MKKLFALAALVLGLASCQNEPEGLNIVTGGEIDTVVTVSIPEATRGSEDSGLVNLAQAAADFDLRYILEVYDVNSDNTRVLREVKNAEVTVKEIAFPVRLIAGRAYKFVVWADFVANESKDDNYYNTQNGLWKVTVNENAWTAMTEARDAYTSFVDVTNYSGTQPINLELTRPFGKLRVVTTDIDALRYIQALPTAVEFQYAAEVYTSFNALYGEAGTMASKSFDSYALINEYGDNVYGEDLENGKQQTLFADYLFVGAEQTLTTKFHMQVTHAYGDKKTEYSFVNDAPIVRNQLTTVIGSILTDANNVKVKIEDEFATKETIEVVKVSTAAELNDALADPEVGMVVMQSDIETEGFVFANPATTSRAAVTYAGRDVIIDGNGNTLTYKGAAGGRIIDFTSAANGANLTIQNLEIINNVSWIERAINYNTNGTLTLEKVTIKSAEGCSLNYAINLPGSSDNAKVEIKNCEIEAGAQALNLWGERTMVNVIDSRLYAVDNNEVESYNAIALNNDGTNSADYSVVNVSGGTLEVIGTYAEGSYTVRNNTVHGVVNVSETTVWNKTVLNPVAIIYWEGQYSYYSKNDLNDALEQAVPKYKATGARMVNDLTLPLAKSAIYGIPVAVQMKNGGVFDGCNNTLSVENPIWDSYVVETYGGTIKNLNITTPAGRGIMISSPKEDIYLDNVLVNGPGYALNTTEHNGKNLVVTNSTFKGWTSLAGLERVSFTSCTFGENTYAYWQKSGYDKDYDRLVRPYVVTMFDACTFEQDFYVDLSALAADAKVTLKNCVCGDVELTAENYDQYITIELPEGRTLADCVVFE